MTGAESTGKSVRRAFDGWLAEVVVRQCPGELAELVFGLRRRFYLGEGLEPFAQQLRPGCDQVVGRAQIPDKA